MKKLTIIVTLLITVTFGFAKIAIAQNDEIAGTFFGDSVSRDNYKFVMRIVLSFQSPWGSIPRTIEQFEKRVWDDLILSYEAYRRNITVSKEEMDEKISETLKSHKVSFNWKNDSDAYALWVLENLKEPVEVFEHQLHHLVQIKKLHTQVLNSIRPTVTEKEALQEFLNEQNSLSVELAEFDKLNQAQEFFNKVTLNPQFWDESSKKDKSQIPEDRTFRTPGFVALEFLMDMWGFPKDAVYAMIDMDKGDFYAPQPIYKGYGVFKILDIRHAEESKFADKKDRMFDQLRSRKKYEGFNDWLLNLREDADIQVFIDPPYEIFP